jgi:DNA-binding PadR family transcriptional regulator
MKLRQNRQVLVLVSLLDGPKHGYAIMTDIRSFAGVELGPGTLYGAISSLERDGLIEPIGASDERRPYRLTEQGLDRARRELADLQQIAHEGMRRLAPS